jgi:hypothetical protein
MLVTEEYAKSTGARKKKKWWQQRSKGMVKNKK